MSTTPLLALQTLLIRASLQISTIILVVHRNFHRLVSRMKENGEVKSCRSTAAMYLNMEITPKEKALHSNFDFDFEHRSFASCCEIIFFTSLLVSLLGRLRIHREEFTGNTGCNGTCYKLCS